MLTVLGTFPKSQKIPGKKNKIGRIVKISSRKTQKNRQFRATRAVITSLPIFEPTFIQLGPADSQQN